MNHADRHDLLTEARATGQLAELTNGQREALELWGAGDGYLRIGLRLGISRDTARDRIRRALRHVKRRAAA